MKIIQVVVSPDGTTKVETNGFSGSSCRQASEFLEHALGSRQSERMKSEFHQSHESNLNTQARQH
ncbi:hypothetical protein RISK_005324 [Rhodopirellula islandica]|uniref:DUF2997 domain-containing protein n=1 Tax=Rhodopirellula islandica TaxID=595434 RepID=A0A0J1B6N4_RHOIS|nr:DUF2997 domain-containing protein [Rhodopirellula islandica]KLU02258.1 hypothetical protein RISK_005324 [Rhodopirellula islandica]